jgi:hypothetical protein
VRRAHWYYTSGDVGGVLAVETDVSYWVEMEMGTADNCIKFCLERDAVEELLKQLQEWLDKTRSSTFSW